MNAPRYAPLEPITYDSCVIALERSRIAHETLRRQSRLKGKPGWKSIKAPRADLRAVAEFFAERSGDR